jgi:hypothetical protein
MAQNQGSQSPGVLSVGNVVSASLRIYRDRFKIYFPLATQSILWIFVPIYGWAKSASILGLISRLAFSEVIERPEAVRDGRRYTNPRIWDFFLANFLVGMIFSTICFTVLFVCVVFFSILGGLIFNQNSEYNIPIIIIYVLLLIVAVIGFVFGFLWLFSRFSIVELPIAIEEGVNSTKAIERSWNLTQGSALRLQVIFLVAFLLTIPISFIIQIIAYIFQFLALAFQERYPFISGLFILLVFVISMAGSTIFIPFWQIIKAVIYYDLIERREGRNLQIDLDKQPY